jgi:hypothetical protein
LTENGLTWDVSYTPGNATNYVAYFLNDSGSTWSDMTIVATVGGSTGSSHAFTNEVFQSSNFATGTTAAFTTIDPATPGTANGGQMVTYEDSDGTGVADGQYLAIRFNNFPTAGQTTPDTSFAFSMSTPATDAPEPSSVLLLMSGLAGLAFMKRKAFQS